MHCPTPTSKGRPHLGGGAHAAAQEEEMIKKQDPTWEDIVSKQLPGGMEEEDWGREEGRSACGGAPVRRHPL